MENGTIILGGEPMAISIRSQSGQRTVSEIRHRESVVDTVRRRSQVRLPSLRSLSIPRFALRRPEAAASLGISEGLFDNWVKGGRMPTGRKIDGIVLWDTRQLAAAWDALVDEDRRANPFDRVVV